ncbi:hypothetical protein PG988_002292 [Apiospora saccharicola]
MADTCALNWGSNLTTSIQPSSNQLEETFADRSPRDVSWEKLWLEIRAPLQVACEAVVTQATKLASCACGLGFDGNLDSCDFQGTTDSRRNLPAPSYTTGMEWGNDTIDDAELCGITNTWDKISCDTSGIGWGNDNQYWELGSGANGFNNEASTYIEIESATGLRLLTEALDIAKEAWYDFCHQYQRDIWRVYFPSGPHEVLLETPMTEEYIGRWNHDHTPPGVTFLSATPALRCVKDLRNAVCHFRPVDWSIKDYDRLLQYAQAVAVALNDEPRAIENLGLVSVAPFRREWKPHHEWFLGGVVNRLNEGHGAEEYQHGPAVWLAVDAWKWQRQSFGMDHDEYQDNECSSEKKQEQGSITRDDYTTRNKEFHIIEERPKTTANAIQLV